MAVRLLGVAMLLVGLLACTPIDPDLEATLRLGQVPRGETSGASGGAGAVATPSRVRTTTASPAWNSRQRVPNYHPTKLTNNAYGPGRSSDIYGRVVYHSPGLQIEETYPGAGDFTDQYGRLVTCQGSGMGTFCKVK